VGCLVYQCIDWLLLSFIDDRRTAGIAPKQTQQEVLTWGAQPHFFGDLWGLLKPDHFRTKAKHYPENPGSRAGVQARLNEPTSDVRISGILGWPTRLGR